ncbi:Pectinesterase [Quillaja saponaria]|uniref:Pectinesterase n=1 Tax=Quillaja saponaria TaxID=32244 RepID=A0AAD7QCR7_QUISA|nr:Pectinesterase [Quillaja saponaria]
MLIFNLQAYQRNYKLCPYLSFMFFIVGILWLATTEATPKASVVLSNFAKFSPTTPTKSSIELEATTPATELFANSIKLTMEKAQWGRALANNLTLLYRKTHTDVIEGIDDCIELLDDSVEQLSNVVNDKSKEYSFHNIDDVQTWLSAALTNQGTCLESLEKYSKIDKGIIGVLANNMSQLISNSLSVYMSAKPKIKGKTTKLTSGNGGGSRRLLSEGFPYWLLKSERRLLEASIAEIGADAVVAMDGSGTHRTIGEALTLAASLAGGGRSVIHVKAGTYNENIMIPTKQKNVMLVGDGKGKTVIVGNRNSDDGWTTYQSATVGAMGDGFIARDITFVNNAGPAKHQAVSLRVGSDKSVIFRCSILGYQDTLYTHSKRQFYRETDIYGTVDFIFGNSAVVFQNCNIYVRKPPSGQQNYIIAQGRSNPNQNTGISLHNCKITAASDLVAVRSKFETFLGRPWQQYSRTVIMQSFLDDLIHPSGWSPWSGGFALKTLYFGEYMNSGPGASTRARVKWQGYHASLTSIEAQGFTVGGFIGGNLWLPSTGVSFDSGLLG